MINNQEKAHMDEDRSKEPQNKSQGKEVLVGTGGLTVEEVAAEVIELRAKLGANA